MFIKKMQDSEENKSAAKFFPKKHWGQNFLVSQKFAQEFARLAQLSKKDVVLEIGPGKGIITRYLAMEAKKVVAVERDQRLSLLLKENLKEFPNVEIVNADIRDLFKKGNSFTKILSSKKRPSYKIVANLPFYLSNFFLRKIFELEDKPSLMVLGLQKEVGERICALPPRANFLGMMIRSFGEIQKGPVISRKFFRPQPEVDARIIVINRIKMHSEGENFVKFLKAGFNQPRKKLISNLHRNLTIEKKILKKAFLETGLGENRRAQELTLEEWRNLWKKMKKLRLGS